MQRILFHIGDFPIYSYGVMISLAVLIIAIFMSRESSRWEIHPDHTLEAIIFAVIGGLLGSRILYVLLNWEHYRENWKDIFFARFEGLTFYGAFLGGLLAVLLWCRWRKVSFFKFTDMAAPYMILGYAFGRIGCFLNGCCYGRISHLPWAVVLPEVDDLPRHPVQLYAVIGSIIIFIILKWLQRYRFFHGFQLLALCALYGMLRFTTEFFREEPVIWMGLTLAQIVSLGLAIVSLSLMLYIFSLAPARSGSSLRK
ncbi:MAG: prolipoprotein diacylglyceryl transferase [Firmicutes bacterium]|jgi:phosphatidylglycerol:prolipoprotein diacylglycerol transferase|nr:prolipoprotein diacylglyceryl transferase [Bacillota bacterium]HPU01064.1 prolipoprotein diacylglyceryl transferase [Bacillota bacterium]